MYVYCIRSWRLPSHSRQSPCSLSSLKGFTLELLKVSYVFMRTAAASFAVTTASGNSLLIGITGSNALGLLWRSVAVTCRFVPRRKRNIYWGYVVQHTSGVLGSWVTDRNDLHALWAILIKPVFHHFQQMMLNVVLSWAVLLWLLLIAQAYLYISTMKLLERTRGNWDWECYDGRDVGRDWRIFLAHRCRLRSLSNVLCGGHVSFASDCDCCSKNMSPEDTGGINVAQ